MKSIYTYYKERLIEISGKNRSLYLKNFNKKNGYDLGKVMFENPELANEVVENFWNGKTVPIEIVGRHTKEAIIRASNIEKRYPDKQFEDEKEKQKYEKQKREYGKKVYEAEVEWLKTLKREIEEIEKETGRYELYMCYPFVYGSIRNYTFKAPLLMFPITIDILDDNHINLCLKHGESVQLNKALMLAFADSGHLDIENLDMEYDCLKNKFENLDALIAYLRTFGIKISHSPRKNIFAFNRYGEPSEREHPEIKHVCLLSRCSLASSIYNDYSALEKKHLTNNSINQLLNTKHIKTKPTKCTSLYLMNNVDYAQRQVVQKVNESGNMVIYGPPGTGKSQTIVNVISDAVAKGKKVLVVSQKKAALEVVYNRLSSLNNKAMFIADAEKQKRAFYERCYTMHEVVQKNKTNPELLKEYDEVTKKLEQETKYLNTISDCLTQKTSFGISLQEMYYNSYKIGNSTTEYATYQEMLKDKNIMSLNYDELENALSILQEKNKAELFYDFVENKQKNPFIDHLIDNLNVHVVTEAQNKLKNLCTTRQILFDVVEYKYSRQILTYYNHVKNKKAVKPLVKMVAKYDYPKADKFLRVACVLFPLYPFAKVNMAKKEKLVKQQFEKTLAAMDEYTKSYDFLKTVLTDNGYFMALDGILNGNSGVLKLLLWAIDNYIELRDINNTLKLLDEKQRHVLNFAYKNSGSYQKYMEVLETLMPIRLYHEIVKAEEEKKETISTIVDFENIRARIVALKKQQNELSRKIAEQGFDDAYNNLMDGGQKNKDYIYQISKKQNFWPIRKTMEVYGEYLFKLFPCWLLSPENVSTILPLEKDLFDVVLFDEASQVFIENTIPSIYRGNTIVVAGDAKQLRPTTTFMKRYMGAGADEDMDYSTQAALEVESLLDLAVSRFNSAYITYHYRSQNEELIDFSNKAFYSGTLQIAPNVSKNIRQKPIERILVDGKWYDRKNIVEAQKVVELTKHILKNRKNKETVGIITFNSEQEAYIEDLMEKQCFADSEFRNLYIKEKNRVDNGEDVSLFVKNLENVQGDVVMREVVQAEYCPTT